MGGSQFKASLFLEDGMERLAALPLRQGRKPGTQKSVEAQKCEARPPHLKVRQFEFILLSGSC